MNEVPEAQQVASEQLSDQSVQMRVLSRRGFIWAAVAVAAALGGIRWIDQQPEEDGIAWPLRAGYRWNEGVWSRIDGSPRLVRTYRPEERTASRENGEEGLDDDFDPGNWKLHVTGVYGKADPVVISLEELKAMPVTEMTTEFFCIEGWSIIQTFKGVALPDFAKTYPPSTRSGKPPSTTRPEDRVRYVSMETPGAGYYVGLDMPSAMHPQTLLCYEMNGKPLTLEHGAPLRLAIPVKYGVKNIKRIGTIRYTDIRPPDYWAEQGYDWYASV